MGIGLFDLNQFRLDDIAFFRASDCIERVTGIHPKDWLFEGNDYGSIVSVRHPRLLYPVDEGSRVALKTVISFLSEETSIKEVVFVLFDSRTFDAYSSALQEITE